MKMKHIKLLVTSLLLSLTLLFGGCSPDSSSETPSQTSDQEVSYNLESIPKYTSEPYVMINENVPFLRNLTLQKKHLKLTVIWMNWGVVVPLLRT